MLRVRELLFLVAGVAASMLCVAATDLYDEREINVFPEHDRIGKTYSLKQTVADGRRLFLAKFTLLDGAGRPHTTGHNFPTMRSEAGPSFQRVAGPDANACAGCHNQPVVGGSGDFVANVFVGAPQFGVQLTDSISAVFSNERNTRSLFGLGAIEIAATEMSRELLAQRDRALQLAKETGRLVETQLSAKRISFGSLVAAPDGDVDYAGLMGVSPDLVIKPFGSKGTVTSLREFTVVALNQHHGIQATEFFGKARTGSADFDADGVADEFSIGQTTAMTLFQAALPAPDNRGFDKHPGFAVFRRTGCDSCHVPALKLNSNRFQEPNAFNREGVLSTPNTNNTIQMPLPLAKEGQGYVVHAFTDLKRHVMCDSKRAQLCNETKKQDKVPLNEFQTTRLWDLATSAPYCHRGDCTTLTAAITAHGGEAAESTDRFEALSRADKVALLGFLKSLGARSIQR